jgi:hypothetical protein
MSDFFSSVGDAFQGLGSAVSGVVQTIGDLGVQLDKGVRDAIPGGWATLGVAALAIAAPYLAPYLAETAPALGVAEGSALTGTGAGAGALATAEGGTAALGSLTPSVAAPIGSTAAGTGIGLTGAAGTGAGAGIGLGTGAGALSSGVAGMGGALGTGLTYGGIGAGPASILSGLASGAGTGSLYGGGMGTVNSLIKGTDPLKGALTGALMGGLTGASLSGIGQTLAQYGINSPALSSAILSTTKGLASGANPATLLANTALNSGLGALGNYASTNLTQAGIDPNLSKILASTGVGAAKAGATGGDPITGAESAALGSTLGMGLNAGQNLLTAPSASATPATIHDYSTPIPNGTVSLAGIEGPLTTDIASQYLKNQADQISSDLAKYYPTLAEQQAALATASTKANDIYTQNQTDKTALSDAINKTGYNNLRANTIELSTAAQTLYEQVAPLQKQYDDAVATYEQSGRKDRESYDLANSLAPKLNELIPQFNTAYTAYDTANKNLLDIYTNTIAPLYTAFTTSSDNLKTALTDYSNNNAELAKTSNIIANDMQGLDKISQGQLASDWSSGEAKMQAPTNIAPADSYYNQLVNAFANPDQPSTTGSQTAANVTVEGAPPTMTDVGGGGGAITPYVPIETPSYPADTTQNSDGSVTVKNSDGSIDNYDANGNLISTTSAPSDNQPIDNAVSPIDIIANLPTDNVPNPVETGALPITPTPTPVETGALPITPTPTPVETGALPITPTPTPVETGALPITPTPTPVETVNAPVNNLPIQTPTALTPTDIINNLPTKTGAGGTTTGGTVIPLPNISAPIVGGTTDGGGTVSGGTTDGGTTPTTGGTTDGGGTVAGGTTPTTGGTTDGGGTVAGGTTPTTGGTTGGGGTVAGGTTPTTGGTTPTTGGTTPTTGGTTPTTGGSGATAGLTAAGLATALAGLGKTGTPSGLSSVETTPTAPKGTFVKGTQIASPLGSFNVPTINYATPTPNPESLQEIENAANGGIMHLASGGSSEDDLSLKPLLMRGKQTQHANLFGSGTIPLYAVPGHADGGSISQSFNPQFYSEGGLGSMQNSYVRGAGTGTSDSIPAMLSNGEFVIPADVVSSLGDGSNDSGAKVLDSFLKTIRAHKRKHDPKHLPAQSKGALGYLLEAKRKVKK